MKKNLAVDVPRDAETEVDRIRGLKKSIFTRTRIACLCLVMVLALSVSSTLAFEKYSGNATPNRGFLGKVELKIGERVGAGTAQTTSAWNTDGNYDYGLGNKVICVKAPDSVDELGEEVTVSIVPEVVSKRLVDADGNPVPAETLEAKALYNGTWTTVQSDANGDFVETSIFKIYLSNIGDGENQWTMQNDGTFKYNSTLTQGQITSDLVKGIVLQDSINITDYYSATVSIVARGDAAASSNES